MAPRILIRCLFTHREWLYLFSPWGLKPSLPCGWGVELGGGGGRGGPPLFPGWDKLREWLLGRASNLIIFCLFPTSAPSFPGSWGSTGAARSVLLTDLGCILMLAEGLPSPSSSTVSKPNLSAVLLEKESLVTGSQILPLAVKGKRREERWGEESTQRLQSRSGCS